MSIFSEGEESSSMLAKFIEKKKRASLRTKEDFRLVTKGLLNDNIVYVAVVESGFVASLEGIVGNVII